MRASVRSLPGTAAFLILALATAACAGNRVRIGTLLEDPGRYEGKTVKVEGKVTQSAGALGYGAFRMDDGTGTMNVVSTAHGAPVQGAWVGVVGTFRALYTFGASSGAAILEKSRYKP